MEKLGEVKEKILEENYKLLIKNIKHGMITKQKVQEIGLEMDGTVNGVFVAQKQNDDLSYVMRLMLDKWWQVKLFDKNTEFGVQELNRILTEVDLQWLAHEMK